jgi:RNA polymerase sigma-70 factor (ECF subfamily)
LVDLFGPEVYLWCRQAGLQESDAADVGQEVFRSVAAKIDGFRRDRQGDTFRGWLWAITRNKLNDFWRRAGQQLAGAGGSEAQQRLAQLVEPSRSSVSSSVAPPATTQFVQRALGQVREGFETRTWQAFWKTTVDEQPAQDVALELGMTPTAVYIAKSRVLRKLREELGELLD